MKRSLRSLAIAALGLGFLTASGWAQTVSLAPRVFVGTIYLAGDDYSWSGSLTASNPTCTLTVPIEPFRRCRGGNWSEWKHVASRLDRMPGFV